MICSVRKFITRENDGQFFLGGVAPGNGTFIPGSMICHWRILA